MVHLLGGDLQIEYYEEKDTIFMTGPATTVFDGEIDLQELTIKSTKIEELLEIRTGDIKRIIRTFRIYPRARK